ncbi:MAG TPA: hypothetical protein VL985_13620, partial [Stellaceae bacterium]|nr:hypothetical protein [Stellaceae bacterium]
AVSPPRAAGEKKRPARDMNSRDVFTGSRQQQPRADGEGHVEDREGYEQMREYAGECEWQEHDRNQDQSVDHRYSDNLPSAHIAAEQLEPANDHNGQPNYADQSLLVSRQIRVPQNRLRRSWPGHQQCFPAAR